MKPCSICDFIVAHDHLPQDVVQHCSGNDGCHATLKGRHESHCASCHRSFGSDDAFDAHLGKNSLCRDPSTLKRGNAESRFHLVERSGASVWVQKRAGGSYQGPKAEDATKGRSTPRRTQGDAA